VKFANDRTKCGAKSVFFCGSTQPRWLAFPSLSRPPFKLGPKPPVSQETSGPTVCVACAARFFGSRCFPSSVVEMLLERQKSLVFPPPRKKQERIKEPTFWWPRARPRWCAERRAGPRPNCQGCAAPLAPSIKVPSPGPAYTASRKSRLRPIGSGKPTKIVSIAQDPLKPFLTPDLMKSKTQKLFVPLVRHEIRCQTTAKTWSCCPTRTEACFHRLVQKR